MKQLFYSVLVVLVIGCSGDSTEPITDTAATETAATSETAPAGTETAATETGQPATTEERPMSEYQNKVAELKTSAGEIHIRFFPDKAPNHVRNFIDLAQRGFYNGTKFHRVIPGFMIQGGDPNSVSGDPNSWGTGGSEQRLRSEFNDISHKRGIVSMARSNDPNSASSQFFIVVKDSTFLDGQYTVFGEVVKGMDVADKIVNAPRGANDRPNDPASIQSITVREAGQDEKPAAK